MATPRSRPLRMYTRPSAAEPLSWGWVEEQLRTAGAYWVTPEAPGFPHPRPVWGIWLEDRLGLSIGTPLVRRVASPGLRATVHLPSATDVVIVEGTFGEPTAASEHVSHYDAKYDYAYDVEGYGPLAVLHAATVLAWRAAGPAGRDGFQLSGSWSFGPRPDAGQRG